MDTLYPATYDAAGNFVSRLGTTHTYDGEHRLTSSTVGGYPTTYTYDGLGRRVAKTSNNVTTVYVYGPTGQLAAEYRQTPSGTPAVSNTAGLFYVAANALGSTRMLLGSDGSPRARLDYLPFGERIAAGTNSRGTEHGNTAARLLFTGKERDAETGLDYFGARFFSGAQGRFTSPDKLNVTDDRLLVPSTLNKYAYAANNPLRFIDPDGRDVVALLEPPHGVRPGHFALFAHNPDTNQAALMSFGPTDQSFSGQLLTLSGGPVGSTVSFGMPRSADDLRRDYTALSIQTSPEQAQAVINFINGFGAAENLTPVQDVDGSTRQQ